MVLVMTQDWPSSIAELPLAEQLRLSMYLAQPCELWSDAAIDRAHVEIEYLLLKGAENASLEKHG